MNINYVEVLKEYFRRSGYELLDCTMAYEKSCPFIIVYDRRLETVAYLDIRRRNFDDPRLRWYRNALHKAKVVRRFRQWKRSNKWVGPSRFDVVEVYLACDSTEKVIDHIVGVEMGSRRRRRR